IPRSGTPSGRTALAGFASQEPVCFSRSGCSRRASRSVSSSVVLSPPTGRPVGCSRVDDSAAPSGDARALTASQLQDFLGEQERRFEHGVFGQSVLFVQALGTKPSS